MATEHDQTLAIGVLGLVVFIGSLEILAAVGGVAGTSVASLLNPLRTLTTILQPFGDHNINSIAAQSVVAMAAGLFILPFFLFSAWAGQLADKLSKRLE